MGSLSVVVPVHNVEEYVRQCLRSILDQAAEDTEIIVVEDCSTDGSAAIVDEISDRDARVQVVTPEVNVGLGVARNLGLAHATGDYVMFVDSDDFLLPDALAAIGQRAETTGADLVVFDHERVHSNDVDQRRVKAPLFEEHPEPITLRDEPRLFLIPNVAWNKAYRRTFLEQSGIEFPVGYYEDIPFTYPLLCLASSIALLDKVCIGYRQRDGGSILSSSSARHLELLDQLERLFDLLDERPEMKAHADAIWHRAATHALVVLSHGPRRLPPEVRRDFFLKAAALLGPRRPADFDLEPRRNRRLKMRLLADGRYTAFQALKRGNAVRTRCRGRFRAWRAR